MRHKATERSQLEIKRIFLYIGIFILSVIVLYQYHKFYLLDFRDDDFLWLNMSTPDKVLQTFTGDWGHGKAYRPLIRVSFLIDFFFFGRSPVGWYVQNLIWHAANAILLAVIMHRFGFKQLAALLGGALFAVSPFSVEDVVWISARTHSIGLFFSLLTIYFYQRAIESDARYRDAAFGAAALAAALASYEASVYALPMVAAILAWGWFRNRLKPRRIMALAAIAMATAASMLAWRALVLSNVQSVPLYPAKPLSILAIFQLIAEMLKAFGDSAEGSMAAAALLLIAAPFFRWRITIGYAVAFLIALLGYLPFLAYLLPPAGRMLYAAQIGPIVAIAMATDVLLKIGPATRLRRFAILGTVLVANSLILSALSIHARDEEAKYAERDQLTGCALRAASSALGSIDENTSVILLDSPTILVSYADQAFLRWHGGKVGYVLSGDLFDLPYGYLPGVIYNQRETRGVSCPEKIRYFDGNDKIIEDLQACEFRIITLDIVNCRANIIDNRTGWSMIRERVARAEAGHQ